MIRSINLNVAQQPPGSQQGFLILPLLVLLLLALSFIHWSAQDLSNSYLSHRLLLYQNCQEHLETLGSQATNSCPPCPLNALCDP